MLDLICFFTTGDKETRAWLVPKGTKAPKAAGKIHSDMERGFIRAEVYKYDDLMEHGSEQELKAKGLMTLEGKEYEIQEGDVVFFRFNVSHFIIFNKYLFFLRKIVIKSRILLMI